jgi:hypothetical protein
LTVTYPSHLRSSRQPVPGGSDAAGGEGNEEPFLSHLFGTVLKPRKKGRRKERERIQNTMVKDEKSRRGKGFKKEKKRRTRRNGISVL